MIASSNNQNIQAELAQTIELRKHLFELYQPYFTNDSLTDVHSQLQQTIREHQQRMHLLYLKLQTTDSKKDA